MSDNGHAAPMLPLRELVGKTGLHPDRIRGLARRGRLKSQLGNDGKRLFEAAAWLTATPQPGAGMAESGRIAELELAVAELNEEIATLQLAAVRLEAERDVAVARAEAERDTAVSIAAAEKAAMFELVAELRRPWWRRVFG